MGYFSKYKGTGILKANRGHEAILASCKKKFTMVLRNGEKKLDGRKSRASEYEVAGFSEGLANTAAEGF